MRKSKLPKTDSIQKLAKFWDKHDLTDFEDELEEVAQPVFARRNGGTRQAVNVPLEQREAKALQRLARAKGISREQLLRRWVLQKIASARN
jgi:protein tyrosine phosphatase (PTP) superfamily phosphohydrolase (DUF442 family)